MSDAFITSGRWIGPDTRPLAAWLTTPADGPTAHGCVILPPIGYEYWTTHRTLRTLAERLAGAGFTVLRVDYDGTGDSAGDQWDGDRLDAWRRTTRHAADELRGIGVTHLTVIGLRFGAALALVTGADVRADAVVAWSPIESGRRYLKELRLLGTPVPPDAGMAEGSLVIAGVAFPAALLAELSAFDTTLIDTAPARAALVIDRPDRPPSDAAAEHLISLGVDVDRVSMPGSEHMLDQPTEYATVPNALVDAITEWVTKRGDVTDAAPRPALPPRDKAQLQWHEAAIVEEITELGPNRLAGIVTRPSGVARDSAATVVFLNTGAEPHIGPGRAWVEYARTLAVAGHVCVRVDFRGWGESPDDGHAPGRPYDPHAVDDTLDVVAHLQAQGHRRIVLTGLCAGAWIALKTVLKSPVAGVLALNPQLYWQWGDPVEATMAETRTRRTPERKREELGKRFGLWTALDLVGVRHPAGRWMRELAAGSTKVHFVFAEGDDGIEFLDNRVHRTLTDVRESGTIGVVEVPQIDHSMHRTWHRGAIVRTFTDFLATL